MGDDMITEFCADPEQARMYARESIVLSLGCRLSEEMHARQLDNAALANKAEMMQNGVEWILEGDSSVAPTLTLAWVARIFAAMDLQVEITVKPLPGKTEPMIRTEADFRRLWDSLAESGCVEDTGYESDLAHWRSMSVGHGRDFTYNETSAFLRGIK